MNTPSIQIGQIELLDFEVPESLRFGGRQRVNVHTLANGRRFIECLGADDSDITFRGIFSGASAELRAKAIDNLRISGESVWLTWESFRRQVLVKGFVMDYHSPWWIPFEITCVVVYQSLGSAFDASGLSAALSSDFAQATLACGGTSVSLSTLKAALDTTNVTVVSSMDQIGAIATVDATLGIVGGEIIQNSNTLDAQLPPLTASGEFCEDYVSMVNIAASVAALVNVKSYVGRIGSNLGDANE